ncbi:4'-phosphopantetheinyl transferase superfamily protein [Azoarcus sp. DN11]|uniref:4'-phosphopantetheinyl transferase family protein n=1 Tax=Azoarcus sp. DN11 TaxID=356837 RepID=UPI000EF334CC|nr:4'-phosphopantetheinyl transferase superfamily protein [Azoarcus sp. DN11]AYH45221.1 hypothetical protein CDA09_17870 [Azoarcus sp. DN11]
MWLARAGVAPLTPPRPRTAGERPPLAAARPEVWLCRAHGPALRDLTHELLRDLLATYLDCRREQVPLRLESGQPPAVAAPWQGLPLSISLSYAAGVGAIGLCAGAVIGIDLAEVAPLPDWERVAGLYLGPQAVQQLAALDDAPRNHAFAAAWSEMEARSKCVGVGLEEWSAARARRLASSSILTATAALPPQPDGRMLVLTVARAPLPRPAGRDQP